MNLNKWVASVCISVVVVLVQVIVTQWMCISNLRCRLEIAEQADRINDDQIRDLAMQMETLRITNESEGHKNFVAGVIKATQTPNLYKEVWHAGYDSGAAVEKPKETVYTSGE